jgi:hypothetical protein
MPAQDAEKLFDQITIPASLITRELGSRIKAALAAAAAGDGGAVVAALDWSESIPDAAPNVTWALWGTSDTGCGSACERLASFLRGFEPTARALSPSRNATGNGTAALPAAMDFAPRFASWRCGDAPECAAQCINHGRCGGDSNLSRPSRG